MKRVKEAFVVDRNGVPFVVQRGLTIDEDHPLVRDHPEHFEDLRVDISSSWQATEVATANPGERRAVVPAIIENQEERASEEDDGLPKEPIKEADYSHAEVKALAIKAKIDPSGTKGDIVKRFNERFEE